MGLRVGMRKMVKEKHAQREQVTSKEEHIKMTIITVKLRLIRFILIEGSDWLLGFMTKRVTRE